MNEYPHFSYRELACRCCGIAMMQDIFMVKLVKMRIDLGFIMPVSSAYRCPVHDKAIGGANVHPTGRAADILVSGFNADTIIDVSKDYGFTGRGVSQRGPHDQRYIHLDDLENGKHPRPWTWSY